jgi:hypothetical protein
MQTDEGSRAPPYAGEDHRHHGEKGADRPEGEGQFGCGTGDAADFLKNLQAGEADRTGRQDRDVWTNEPEVRIVVSADSIGEDGEGLGNLQHDPHDLGAASHLSISRQSNIASPRGEEYS